ncbi:hypothetical protein DFH06DRAFT_1324046 [Mycena polygramma]|nr:hypothetical protein DFH06DRAFT_1324046 [Mycena polygramma]
MHTFLLTSDVRFASVPGDLRLARYRHLSRRGVQQFLGRMTLSLASPPSSTDKLTDLA